MARILVVDDDPMVLRMVVRMLTDDGNDCIACENGRHAMDQLKDVSVNLVITDINMPEMNGIDLIRNIKATQKDLPVVVISGGARTLSTAVFDSIRDMGVAHILTKPFMRADLLAAVNETLQRPQ